MSAPLKGLHSPLYVAPQLIDECLAELPKLVIRISLGDRVTPLERLAYHLLRANHLIMEEPCQTSPTPVTR